MSQVILNPSADTVLISSNPTTNYGTSVNFSVGELNGGVRIDRSLIKFDLSAYTGLAVSVATLRLYDTGGDYTNNTRTMILYRLKRAWTEAGATWNKYDGTNDWGTAGAGNASTDYDNNLVGSISMLNPPSAGYVDITITPSYVNEWLNGTMTNNGFSLYMQTETDDLHEFYSRDNGSNKPELVLTFPDSGFFALL